jgi:hypothetical protein
MRNILALFTNASIDAECVRRCFRNLAAAVASPTSPSTRVSRDVEDGSFDLVLRLSNSNRYARSSSSSFWVQYGYAEKPLPPDFETIAFLIARPNSFATER